MLVIITNFVYSFLQYFENSSRQEGRYASFIIHEYDVTKTQSSSLLYAFEVIFVILFQIFINVKKLVVSSLPTRTLTDYIYIMFSKQTNKIGGQSFFSLWPQQALQKELIYTFISSPLQLSISLRIKVQKHLYMHDEYMCVKQYIIRYIYSLLHLSYTSIFHYI